MVNKNESESVLNPMNGALDPAAAPGARRASGAAAGLSISKSPLDAGMEVVPRTVRQKFTNADKRRILEAADRCTKPGEIGALLRRERVYSSCLSAWRQQRRAADLVALAPQKRG